MRGVRINSRRGLTLVEVLVLLAVLLGIFVLALTGPRHIPQKIHCIDQLKVIGVGFRSWALDCNDLYPMQVPEANGGTKEFGLTTNVFMHFQVLSNELITPRILVCPEDRKRVQAVSFEHGIGNSNVSYFVGLDAVDHYSNLLLAGDRNLTNGPLSLDRVIEVESNSAVGWTGELHNQVGNIVLADGSSQMLITAQQLRDAVSRMGEGTNRLAIP